MFMLLKKQRQDGKLKKKYNLSINNYMVKNRYYIQNIYTKQTRNKHKCSGYEPRIIIESEKSNRIITDF